MLKTRILNSIRNRKFGSSFDVCYQQARTFLKNCPQPILSKSEKIEIDDFWAEYGIKWPDYSWFQMYYNVSGVRSPEFIPDPLAAKVLYPYYNPIEYVKGWDDKNIYERLLPIVEFPNSLCHCIKSRFYDRLWNPCGSSDEAIHTLASKIWDVIMPMPEIIVKETSNTDSGRGVKLYHINSSTDIETILKSNRTKDFIMQKKIIQHPIMGKFCSTSVNIVRIVSLRYKDDVLLFPPSIRFGIEGAVTDVSFLKGKEIVNVMGIYDDGSFNGKQVSFCGMNKSDIQVNQLAVPSFSKICEIINKAHKQMYYFDLIGWDFAVDEDSNPICIEYNVVWPGTILYQYTNGPFCGNYTRQFLEPLYKEAIRNRIPSKYRIH